MNPDGQTAYVGVSDAVLAIDLANGTVKATIPLPPTNALPSYLAVSPNGKQLFINYAKTPRKERKQNLILRVDTSTNKVIKTIVVRGRFSDYGQTAITPDGKFLYAPVGELLMLDTVTNKIVDSISLNATPTAVAVAPTAPFACAIGLYGNNDEGELYVIDISRE